MFAPLPEGPLDVVGDVHGELDALHALLAHLGYDADGHHPDGRRLVFVGDLCDRGPDSPGVIALVQRLVRFRPRPRDPGQPRDQPAARRPQGRQRLVLERVQRRATPSTSRARTCRPTSATASIAFLRTLPLALERDDLRVVHAGLGPGLDRAAARRRSGAEPRGAFPALGRRRRGLIAARGIGEAARIEYEEYRERLVDPAQAVPMLVATAQVDEIRQMANPIRVVTSGIERGAARPFFASGHWRFVERIRWWDEYADTVPVIVGHYWRQFARVDRASLGKAEENLFTDLAPTAWHGLHRNVFCIDFSVGGRFLERPLAPGALPRSRLGALRWPERVLALDTGEMLPTSG